MLVQPATQANELLRRHVDQQKAAALGFEIVSAPTHPHCERGQFNTARTRLAGAAMAKKARFAGHRECGRFGLGQTQFKTKGEARIAVSAGVIVLEHLSNVEVGATARGRGSSYERALRVGDIGSCPKAVRRRPRESTARSGRPSSEE